MHAIRALARAAGTSSILAVAAACDSASPPTAPAFALAARHAAPDPSAAPIEEMVKADKNGNQLVCVHVAPGNGKFVIKDDSRDKPCPSAFKLVRAEDSLPT